MGHYFLKLNSKVVMGINNSGVMLVARKDLLDPVFDEVTEKARNI